RQRVDPGRRRGEPAADAGVPQAVRGAPEGVRSDSAMTKPAPETFDPAELVRRALAVIHADRFPQLATIDGDQPRVRPVSPVKTDGFTVYVANLRMYHKTAEIAANPNVELCYLDEGHNQVRLTGVAEVVTERPVLEQSWEENPL